MESHKIISKEVLVQDGAMRIVKMAISAPTIASKVRAGQFVVVMVNASGERVPLTVAEKDVNKGTITIIFQEAGFTTRLIGGAKPGEDLYALAGPLGHATEIKKYGKVILVGGGVGIAEIYPVARALKDAGNDVTVVIGARSKNLLILEKELTRASDRLLIATDDGSYGVKGFTTDIVRDLLSKDQYKIVYAVGPIPMMKMTAKVTKEFNVHTIVSLNALMVDATGMCGCCRVTVGEEVKFSCVDGPEFDAHLVQWDELTARNKIYLAQEKHICSLNKL